MPFERPTLTQIDDRIRNDITTSLRIPNTARTAPLLRRSVVAVKSRVYAGACHLLYGFLAWLAKQRFVHSMEAEFLDAEEMTYDMPRTGEETAAGCIIVAGNDGATIPAERIYQHTEGSQYRVTAAVMIAGGTSKVHLEAVTPGAAANLKTGETLRLLSPLDGVQTTAVVDEDGIAGGVDTESDEAYRERILDRKRQPPHGGAAHDYVAWAKEVPGVTRAWCLPLWMGEGTVWVMFMRDNDINPFPNDEQLALVQAHIDQKRPVTAKVFVFCPQLFEVEATVKLSPDTEATRVAVELELDDLLYREGEPDGYLYVSRISEAISIAAGEHHHYLHEPTNDIHIPKNAVPTLKRVIYLDNPEG